jgi:hypothetical protein
MPDRRDEAVAELAQDAFLCGYERGFEACDGGEERDAAAACRDWRSDVGTVAMFAAATPPSALAPERAEPRASQGLSGRCATGLGQDRERGAGGEPTHA